MTCISDSKKWSQNLGTNYSNSLFSALRGGKKMLPCCQVFLGGSWHRNRFYEKEDWLIQGGVVTWAQPQDTFGTASFAAAKKQRKEGRLTLSFGVRVPFELLCTVSKIKSPLLSIPHTNSWVTLCVVTKTEKFMHAFQNQDRTLHSKNSLVRNNSSWVKKWNDPLPGWLWPSFLRCIVQNIPP